VTVVVTQPDWLARADCGMTALTVLKIKRLLAMTPASRTPTGLHTEFHLTGPPGADAAQARARWHHYRTPLALTA
jgi:hypothetical protein